MKSAKLMLLAALLPAGCASKPLLEPGFESSLTATEGCDGVYLVARDASDSTGLVFRAFDSPLQRLREGAEPITYDPSSSDEHSILVAELGDHVSRGYCSGTTDSTQVENRYHSLSGTVTLRLDGQSTQEQVIAELADITLGEEHGDHRIEIAAAVYTYSLTR